MSDEGANSLREWQPDRHKLYEACVQRPGICAAFLRGLWGKQGAGVLREDFCGTAAVSREWAKLGAEFGAVGVDLDAEVLEAGRARSVRAGVEGRVRLVRVDATVAAGAEDDAASADVVYVGNFSIGEIHEREVLVRYLRTSERRLRAGGVFVCDTYAGESAFRTGYAQRIHAVDAGVADGYEGIRVHCIWEQREADLLNARVCNAIHFRVEQRGEVTHELFDAFVYRWRLWTVPELRDAMIEAGFASVGVEEGVSVSGSGREGEEARAEEKSRERRVVCVVGRKRG